MIDWFNEGIAQGIGLGELRERECIIKLLEERYEGDEFVEEIIELIKGKTK